MLPFTFMEFGLPTSPKRAIEIDLWPINQGNVVSKHLPCCDIIFLLTFLKPQVDSPQWCQRPRGCGEGASFLPPTHPPALARNTNGEQQWIGPTDIWFLIYILIRCRLGQCATSTWTALVLERLVWMKKIHRSFRSQPKCGVLMLQKRWETSSYKAGRYASKYSLFFNFFKRKLELSI